MNDRKPFRVTNETLSYVMSADMNEYDAQGKLVLLVAKEYGADLLDARELIDKQEALIKEMREELEDARMVMEKYEAQLTGEIFNDPSLNAILENTREYA